MWGLGGEGFKEVTGMRFACGLIFELLDRRDGFAGVDFLFFCFDNGGEYIAHSCSQSRCAMTRGSAAMCACVSRVSQS